MKKDDIISIIDSIAVTSNEQVSMKQDDYFFLSNMDDGLVNKILNLSDYNTIEVAVRLAELFNDNKKFMQVYNMAIDGVDKDNYLSLFVAVMLYESDDDSDNNKYVANMILKDKNKRKLKKISDKVLAKSKNI